MKQAIIEVVFAQGQIDGFGEAGGCRVILECGHKKQWDGGFPVPVPRVDDLFECKDCVGWKQPALIILIPTATRPER